MQLPYASASPEKRYRFGRYPLRALTRAGLPDLQLKLEPVNEEIRRLSRELEDLDIEIEDKNCDRDQLDGELDDLPRLARNQMLGRGVGLDKQEPYLSCFPEGLEEYTGATLGKQVEAYGLLCSRLEAHLDPTDPVRVTILPQIRQGLADWSAAVAAIDSARQARDLGARRLEVAVARWEATLLEVHALLVARFGSKKKADRFFPKIKSRKVEPPIEAAPPPTTEADPPPAEVCPSPEAEAAEPSEAEAAEPG